MAEADSRSRTTPGACCPVRDARYCWVALMASVRLREIDSKRKIPGACGSTALASRVRPAHQTKKPSRFETRTWALSAVVTLLIAMLVRLTARARDAMPMAKAIPG